MAFECRPHRIFFALGALFLFVLASEASAFVVPSRSHISVLGSGHERANLFRPALPSPPPPNNAPHRSSLRSVKDGALTEAPRLVLSFLTSFSVALFKDLGRLTASQRAIFAGTFALGFALGRVRPFWRRLTSVQGASPSLFGPSAPIISGRAVSVSDGDTIRFLHVPTPFHPKELRRERKEKVSEVALPVRICTIDTPETAKFGKSGQPMGNEAKDHLKKLLEGKTVRIRMLQSDQYGRAVAEVLIGRGPFRRYADEYQLRAGMAEVYQGGGAVYGPKGRDAYLDLESEARKEKKGIWGLKNRESAAEYKKRTK